jgi:hypothetical protein
VISGCPAGARDQEMWLGTRHPSGITGPPPVPSRRARPQDVAGHSPPFWNHRTSASAQPARATPRRGWALITLPKSTDLRQCPAAEAVGWIARASWAPAEDCGEREFCRVPSYIPVCRRGPWLHCDPSQETAPEVRIPAIATVRARSGWTGVCGRVSPLRTMWPPRPVLHAP